MTEANPQTPSPLQDNRSTDNRGANTTAWVVAAVVALVAIIAVTFMVTSQPDMNDPAEIARAQDLGRAEGMMAGAQSSMDAARSSASAAADRTAADASQASADARAAADAAARSADSAAANAADTVRETPPEPTPQ
ncbi:MAG: hypothetical protein Q8L23_17675 [Caulobacter sp.]|nr:hypothetical protein [Caulobacter sp.]